MRDDLTPFERSHSDMGQLKLEENITMASMHMTVRIYGQVNTPQREEKGEERGRERLMEKGVIKRGKEGSLLDQAVARLLL